MNITPEQMVSMVLDQSAQIEEAQTALEQAVHAEARAERAVIRAKAEAWRKVEGRSREEREAFVDEMACEEKVAFKEAVGVSKAAMERVRNKRQQLSALQTASNGIKEEAVFARTSPEEPAWTSRDTMDRLGGGPR